MITRNFNLYLNAGHSVPLVINVNQYDSGEQWVFTLYNADGTQYTPSTGAIVGIKSDGLGIINSGSVVDGKVVINETSQMTAAVGKAVFELLIDSQTHGTANFVVLVEEKPGNNADMSESDLSLLQEAIDATSPLPTGGSVGQVLTKTASGSTWSDAGTPTQEQVADAVSDWADEHITVTTGVVIDTSLSVAGAAADAKKVGDEISDLKSAVGNLNNLQTEDKTNLVSAINEAAESGGGATDSYMYVEGTTLFMGDNMTETISITENGSYNVKKYATANVNVPTGVTPTGTLEITANGTFNVTNYASAHVDVPTGGGTPTDQTVTYSDWVNKGITSSSGSVSANDKRCMLPHNLIRYKSITVPAEYDFAVFACSYEMASNGIWLVSTYIGGWTGSDWQKTLTWHTGTMDLTQLTGWDTYALVIILRNHGSDSSISTTAGESVQFTYNVTDRAVII